MIFTLCSHRTLVLLICSSLFFPRVCSLSCSFSSLLVDFSPLLIFIKYPTICLESFHSSTFHSITFGQSHLFFLYIIVYHLFQSCRSLPVLWTIFCFIILKWLETNFFFLLKPLLNLTFHNIFLALEFRVMLAVIAPSSQSQDLDKLVFYFPMFSYSFHTPCSLPLFQSLTKIPSLVCSNSRFIAC